MPDQLLFSDIASQYLDNPPRLVGKIDGVLLMSMFYEMARRAGQADLFASAAKIPTQCNVLSDVTQYVGEWSTAQEAVKEESMSDWLLYEVSKRLPNVTYRAFTRHEEARIYGADWEWWFVFRKANYKFRVQAKKLKFSADNYPSISYSNAYGMQVDKLIANAKKAVPLYAFFCSSKDAGLTRCSNPTGVSGVFIVNAHTVHDSYIAPGRALVKGDDVLGQTVPLSCITCCPLARPGRGFEKFVREYLSKIPTPGAADPETEVETGYHAELPEYVSSLLAARQDLGTWWDEQHATDVQDVKAILVHDFRNLETEERGNPDERFILY